MAFPPPTLPTNKTNATPQLDDHPGEHNALAQAVNDLTAHLTTGDAPHGVVAAARSTANNGLQFSLVEQPIPGLDLIFPFQATRRYLVIASINTYASVADVGLFVGLTRYDGNYVARSTNWYTVANSPHTFMVMGLLAGHTTSRVEVRANSVAAGGNKYLVAGTNDPNTAIAIDIGKA